MLDNIEKVDEEIRRQNTYWIMRRNKWRERYDTIATEIKYRKELYAQYPNLYNATLLSALRTTASIMMHERQEITTQLKHTAYRYC